MNFLFYPEIFYWFLLFSVENLMAADNFLFVVNRETVRLKTAPSERDVI